MRRLATLVLLVGTTAVDAAPSRPDARAEFDRGVAAYSRGDYATAAGALATSYRLEADPETLFAWAQSERKQGHCAKAIELYTTMLGFELGDENRREITEHIHECKATLPTRPPPPPPVTAGERRAWWKDPIGGVLVGAGVASGIAGAVFLVQAHDAKQDRATAATYSEYMALYDRAKSRGQLGIVTTAAGGALVLAGIAWYAVRSQPRTATVTGWLDSSGGGVGLAKAF